ncbi:hypothetical protein KHQ08_09380 [Pseudochrobactrum algeriensis]|uniref:hypothetical protein n=1 Tax=Pseudochrobactrum algeriensis TaxID=2834768 RepID=UPI001BD023F2|nr:hypothetical protein [Pseudochrobactrum algeriensis]QVQ38167.1 hypothetical protein KHQ08_09380 [Pseudochrobactrum algeriensis]QVQ41393.1 hypothetical protein KHQ07_07685 [Pseudochrobactrum algeriensis]QVQ45315.1 hypothetical protein KHQ09_09640 [Pseudochrobactrum algeriensis]
MMDSITVATVDLRSITWVSQGVCHENLVQDNGRVYLVHIAGQLRALSADYADALLIAERIGRDTGIPVIDVVIETLPENERLDLVVLQPRHR